MNNLAKILPLQFFRKAAIYALAFLTLFWAMGLMNWRVPVARAAIGTISGVTLSDTDTANFGLDGRDFHVEWTAPTPTEGSQFSQYMIYLIGAAITDGDFLNNLAMVPYAPSFTNLAPLQNTSWTGPQFLTQDAATNVFSSGQHTACVVALTTDYDFEAVAADEFTAGRATFKCSAPTSIAGESGVDVVDTNAPFIDHLSAFNYIDGAGLIVYALIDDDQTTPAQFANTGDGQQEFVKMFFDGTTEDAVTDSVNGTLVEGTRNLYKFDSATTLSRDMKYYLTAKDRAGNTRYFATNPEAASAAVAAGATFEVMPADEGSEGGISGTVKDFSNVGIGGAIVFVSGLGVEHVTTQLDGTYEFVPLPDGFYDVTVVKEGYCKAGQTAIVSEQNTVTNLDFSLALGDCFTQFGGEGGDDFGGFGGAPNVVFSGPPQDDHYAPLDQPLRVGFSSQLNASTVNDTNAADAGSNIYLTSDGSTKIAGSVNYCASNASPGCSALFGGDQNVVVFTPAANLTAGKFYTLVMTGAVTGDSGQAIQGNRSGGGHELRFSTGGEGFTNFASDIGANFGAGGQFMPPFVEAMTPAPGINARPNTKILVRFNQAMDSTTITSNNVSLRSIATGQAVNATPVLDNTERRTVTITPASALSAGEYEVRVLGAVANSQGVPMRDPANAANEAFSGFFNVSGSADTTPPTIYPNTATGATGVSVNQGVFEYGFNEQLDPATVSTTNISMKRGSTAVNMQVNYDPGSNTVFVTPNTVLAPNTSYTVQFGTGVTDLAGNALSTTQSFSFTTSGMLDTTKPKLKEVRCDDYRCTMFFNEAMNNDSPSGGNYANSVLKPGNYTLTAGPFGEPKAPVDLTGKAINYNAKDFSASLEGLMMTADYEFSLTVSVNAKDLAGNAMDNVSNANVVTGHVENSAETFGVFDGGGMFGPPPSGEFSGGVGGTGMNFDMGKSGGFGGFTADEFMFGEAVQAFPFNPTAGGDVNVFQVRVPMSKFGQAPVNDDQLVIVFPSGTNVTNTKPDTFSPFYSDFNQQDPGIITFDAALDTDGVAVDATARTVTVQLAVSGGTPTSNDFVTVDLRGITNPSVPKGPEAGGYTAKIKLVRGGAVLDTLTSMPYFIQAGGSNSITVNIYAGSQVTPTAGANGNLFVFAGGPSGPLDRQATLTDGEISAVEGSAATEIAYTSLSDGCYFIGTEPFATLGGVDYFGEDFPEPICVNGGESKTKNIVFTSAAAVGSSVPVTVTVNNSSGFSNVSAEIFAGGPGRFVSKAVTLNGVSTTATINLPKNGFWNVGVGPAMPKGPSAGKPDFEAFGSMPPAPVDLQVSGLPSSGAVTSGFFTPSGASFNDNTDTVTFTIKTSSINIPVSVTDGSTGLANVDVFAHQKGFGAGAFGTTNKNGAVTLKVADYGPYEIGAFKPGLGDVIRHIDVRNEGGTKIYLEGVEVATVPLKILRPDYIISGKVLDADGNAIGFAPVWGESNTGRFVHGQSSSDGSYSLAVSAGTWNVRSELPPSQTELCGTISKSVIVTNESKANQTLEPSTGTCFSVTGTVTVGGEAQANSFVFIESWDTVNDRPSGGFHRGMSTNSSGVYTAKVPAGTYRFGTFSPDFGEITTTETIAGVDTVDLNSGTLGNITFSFTGGTSAMNGFVEVKKANDKHTRLGKPFNGAVSDTVLAVPEGDYEYFVDIFGVGKFNGSVATGGTATINADVTLVTLSGTVFDSDDDPLARAKVMITNPITGVTRVADTDDNGEYSLDVKVGTYTVTTKRSSYVAGEAPASLDLSEDTVNYNFGGIAPDQEGMIASNKTITGTIYESDGETPVTKGFVWAENSAGQIVSAPVDATDGSYNLPVTSDSAWTVKAVAPLHGATTLSGAINTADVTADTGKDLTLTADSSKEPKTVSSTVAVSTGGTIDDTDNTGVKLTAPGSTLTANGSNSGNANVQIEKSFASPATEEFAPLGNISYDLDVTDSNNLAVKDFAGNVTLTFDYDPDDLPNGVTEDELTATYYSQESSSYVPCEGGSTVDTTNNTVTCVVNHATTFAVTYSPSSVSAASVSSGDSTPPVAPSGVAVSGVNGKATLTWTDPADSDLSQIVILRNNGGTTPIDGMAYALVTKGTGTYVDTAVTVGQTYKYIVRAKDGAGNTDNNGTEYSVVITAASTTGGGGGGGGAGSSIYTAPTTTTTETTTTTVTTPTTLVTEPSTTAEQVTETVKTIVNPSNIVSILARVKAVRDLAKEGEIATLATKDIREFKLEFKSTDDQAAYTNFVVYGNTDAAVKLGSGERRAVLRDYLDTVKRTDIVWEDVERLTTGQKPVKRNLGSEVSQLPRVLTLFETLYGHRPNFQDPAEDLAWNYMMYRIRPATRDLAVERLGIEHFKRVLKRNPVTPQDWAAVKALAYVKN